MSGSRDAIFGALRRQLKRDAPSAEEQAAMEARLAAPAPNLIPKRGQLDRRARIDLFVAMAEEAACTVVRVARREDLPGAVAAYLAGENLPAAIRLAPDAAITGLPWKAPPPVGRPMIEISQGPTDGHDLASLTPAFAGIAETGTLMLVSGPESPTTLNLLPDHHLVLLTADQVVGSMEEGWSRLRARYGAGGMPRTVNFITGPSRSGDIEQKIQMGAHGPRKLHILLLDGEATP
ncbi:MAG: lactate utilization protein [Dongiaceae bacterium]